MIAFRCPSCQMSLQAKPTEAGQKINCPSCGQRLQVPGRPPVNRTVLGELAPELSINSGLSLPPSRSREQEGPRPTAKPPVPTVLPVAWYSSHQGEREGPYSEEDMRRRARKGDLRRKDPVWTAGMAGWQPAEDYFSFPPVTPPSAPPARQLPTEEASPGGRVCGVLSIIFGGVAFLPFCPWLFGLAGLILGIISLCICSNKTLGAIGTPLSAVGMMAGWCMFAVLLGR
jgi:DNA-directed RNA polymerase subunit RPC12/RpoP